jgi:hypothetical protein
LTLLRELNASSLLWPPPSQGGGWRREGTAVANSARRKFYDYRPGNVHSAEDWAELLLPEIERQQELGKEVVFRADAAFAKPEIYKALEERGVKYAIRIPANDSLKRDIAELLTRELEDGAAYGGKGGVPLRGVVSPSGVHRDQPGDTQPERGALL